MDELSRLIELFHGDTWPEAAPDSDVCDPKSEKDKQDRAEDIVRTVFHGSFWDRNFLDVGCGQGHVCEFVAKHCAPKVSMGYDIARPGRLWKQEQNGFQLVNDWATVEKNGPYQTILLYDVLDHTADADAAIELLKKVEAVCAPHSTVFIRNHPWSSRHGGHLYHKANKAFAHLVFDEDELKEMGWEKIPPVQHVTHPIATYNKWLSKAGFEQTQPKRIDDELEDFFKTGLVRERIKRHWQNSKDSKARRFPEFQIKQSYVDYTLRIKG